MAKEETLLNQLNDGKNADTIYTRFVDFLEARRKKIIQGLKTDHRQGKRSESDYVARVAALVELDDLQSEIENTIKRGRAATKELHGDPLQPGNP